MTMSRADCVAWPDGKSTESTKKETGKIPVSDFLFQSEAARLTG
jgi:hypothetical protein